MYGVTSDNKLQRPLVDRVTHALEAIETDHANIHEGIAYGAWHTFNIAAGQSAYLHIVAPIDKYVHFKPSLYSTDGPSVFIDLAEGGTTVSDGTAILPRNKRRVGSTPDTSAMLVYYAPGTPVMGTIVDSDFIGGGTGNGASKTGASMPGKDEIVLKPGSKYLMRITNSGTNTVNTHVKMFWYEEPKG